MILCPICHNIEITGALYCSECGADLVNIARPRLNGPTNSLPTLQMEYLPLAELPAAAGDAAAALLLIGKGILLPLAKRAEYTLGRSNEKQPIVPDVDLSPYGGYEEGVSRLHASINIGDSASVTDLGSINGTRVNGKLIPPNTPQPLQNEDLLTLGKMKVQILLRIR